MTTDDFAEAAEDRVDELWPYAPAGFPLPPARRMDRRIGFRLGAQWARAHLAAQGPTDAEKDAAMDALGCELRVVENGQTTCDLHGGYATSDDVWEVVEVALSATRAARRDEKGKP